MIIGRDIYVIEIASKAADAELKKLRSGVDDLRDRFAQTSTTVERMDSSLTELADSGRQVVQRLREFRTGLLETDAAANLAARAFGLVKKAINALREPVGIANAFETELAAIDTITNRVGTRFADQFLDISERTGQQAAEIARATYEAVSAGVAEESAAQFVELSNQLARSGRAGLTESLELLATIKEQFGLTVDQLGRVNSVLFLATRDGRTKISELADDLGQVIPIAKAAGQGLEDIAAAVTSITKGGVSTNIAATQIRSYGVAVQKNSAGIAKALTAVGHSISETGFRSLTFLEQVRLLTKAFGGNEGALIKLFGRIEGVQAVLNLGRDGAIEFEKSLRSMAGASDEASIAAGRFAETGAAAQARLRATFERQMIALGREIMPAVTQVLGELVQLVRDNGEQIAVFIKGIARSAVDLGEFIADYGKPILFFFGALLAQSAITRAVGLATALGGVAKAISPIGVAASASALGVGKLATAVGGLSAALPLLVLAAQRAGAELGEMLGKISLAEQGIADILSRLDGRAPLQKRLGSFESADALQARRQQIVAGDQVLLTPEKIDEARGLITRAAAEATESIVQLFDRGADVAQEIAEKNLAAFARSAAAQNHVVDGVAIQIEDLGRELLDLNAQIEAQTNDFGAQLSGEYTKALVRRAELEQQIEILHDQSDSARRRAAEMELARANLAAKFQAEASKRLGDTLRRLEEATPILSGLGRTFGQALTGDLPAAPKPPKPRGPRRQRAAERDVLDGIVEEYVREQDAETKRLQGIADRNADNRVGALEDAVARELAVLDLRFQREHRAAEAAGDDLAALRTRQDRELGDVLDRLAVDRAERTRQRAAVELQFIADLDERQLEALRQRHEQERAAARDLGVDLVQIRASQEQQITDLIEQQNQARLDSHFTTAGHIKDSAVALFAILETVGLKSQVATGVQVVAEGLFLQAKAIRYGILAVEKGLELDPRAFGYAALALKAQADAARQYQIAATLGAGRGGGGGGSGGGGGGGGRRAGPTADGGSRPLVRERQDQQPMVVRLGDNHFHGDVYDTREEADRAFGRRSLRGLQALEGRSRGLARVDFSQFDRRS